MSLSDNASLEKTRWEDVERSSDIMSDDDAQLKSMGKTAQLKRLESSGIILQETELTSPFLLESIISGHVRASTTNSIPVAGERGSNSGPSQCARTRS
jgi:hypothetical protein